MDDINELEKTKNKLLKNPVIKWGLLIFVLLSGLIGYLNDWFDFFNKVYKNNKNATQNYFIYDSLDTNKTIMQKRVTVDTIKKTKKQVNIKSQETKNQILKDTKQPQIFNVISNNQKSGVTAGIVNNYYSSVEKRHLSVDTSGVFLLPFSGIKCYIHYRSDDNETVIFKDNIIECLSKSNWIIGIQIGHGMDESLQNTLIEINPNLKNGDKAYLAAIRLAQLLEKNRIKVFIDNSTPNSLSNDEMYIRIGVIR